MRRVTHILGTVTLGVLMVGGGAAWAQNSGMPATPTPAKTESQNQEHKESKAVQSQESRHAAQHSNVRSVRGRVTAVETSASPETLTMTAGSGTKMETVGVDVPSTTKIIEGKSAKKLGDITVGDRIALRYERQNDRLVAQQIRILGTPHGAKAASHTGPAAAMPTKG